MTVEAARAFRGGFEELEQSDMPAELRQKVVAWYEADFLKEMSRILGKEQNIADYLPTSAASYYLQYHYIVTNPIRRAQRDLVDDPGDGSVYSRHHAVFHPLMRAAADGFGFFDMLLADPRSGRIGLFDGQGNRFRDLAADRALSELQYCGRRRALRRLGRPVGGVLRGFRALRALCAARRRPSWLRR